MMQGLMQRVFVASSRCEDRSQVNTHSMMSPRLARSVLGMLGMLGSLYAGVAVLSGFSGAASAQGRLDARYEATLAGIPVGKGTWTIDIGDDQFTAAAAGGTAGLMKAFAGGSGSSPSQGKVVNGALVATGYTASTSTQKKSETIRMGLINGYVKDFVIDPEPPVDPARLPVSDAQRHGVQDPRTGGMLRVPGNGDVMAPDSCRTGASVFDG